MIKSHTDIEQSKKLAEFLTLESADMHYMYRHWEIDENTIGAQSDAHIGFDLDFYYGADNSKTYHYIPCWSLAALLDVLPNNENISTNLSKGCYRISTLEYTNSWCVDYEDETDGLNNCVTSADNPVDACVAMIEKLHELNLL